MILPKKVIICGKTYKVAKNNKSWGGQGSTGKQQVTVGTKNNQSVERIFENYLHEVSELVLCEQCLSFTASNDEVAFVMNHNQFDRFVNNVASAIYPLVK